MNSSAGSGLHPTLARQFFSGTHYQVGRALGATLGRIKIPPYPRSADRLAQRCRELLGQVYPPALEKLRGIIDACNLPGELVENHYFVKGIPVPGCASLVVLAQRSFDGAPLVGRAYHWLLSDRRWCVLRETHITNTFASLAYTHHWVGTTDVVNEGGLYCGIFKLPGGSSTKPALQWHTIVDMIMETCRTVSQAVARMSCVPHFRCLGYVLADAEGGAAVVEASPQGVQVRGAVADLIVATNHYLSRQIGFQNRPHSLRMYQRIMELVGDCPARIGIEDVKRILADHKGGICSGTHNLTQVDADSWGTLYALVARPHDRQLEVAPGHPCMTAYEKAGFAEARQSRSA